MRPMLVHLETHSFFGALMPYPTYAERNVRAYLVKRVREEEGEIKKVRWIGRRFAPDDFVWIPKWKFPKMAETKAPGEKPSPGQEREHIKLRRMGIEVWVLDSYDAVDSFLK